MPNEIKNADSFESTLDALAEGFGRKERFEANEAGAEKFKSIMKPKVPVSVRVRKGEHVHLRDSLVTDEHANGAVDIGFTAKGQKGYIARFQNDGWDVKDRNGKNHSHIEGKHFWEETQREAKGEVGKTVINSLRKSMDRKVK
ncbi:phage tail protein [Pediococcus stilesii]|uniref:Phage tail protein n=1 Tax=Pediococcus stilesii TaxID=331679 RepID=A0A5R9BSQ8_9LACO|nr:phage tail protein [Pediococcus stilesii]TLQ03647.1 phage tail protein [Pediococcus stilesii]